MTAHEGRSHLGNLALIAGMMAGASMEIRPRVVKADAELTSPEFEAVWQLIKAWDINVPAAYSGYMGATGNHVRAILDALHTVGESARDDARDRLLLSISEALIALVQGLVPSAQIHAQQFAHNLAGCNKDLLATSGLEHGRHSTWKDQINTRR